MKVAQFEIHFQQWLDETGQLTQALPDFFTDAVLVQLYESMQQVRLFDAKAIALQRTGKLGTYPSTLGQEAIGVAVGTASQAVDVFCPYYRETGAQLLRGASMAELLCYWGGDERGMNFEKASEDLPYCVPIASQTLHAVGVATAMKLRQQKRAVVVVVGDGGTSRGDFYEALNVAGVWGLPVVFVINNNQYAISVPLAKQTAAKTLAQKGIAAGIRVEQVDGNDVIGLTQLIREALAQARVEKKPSLIEAITYRLCDHTTADDAKRYRSDSELKAHFAKEPIARMDLFLRAKKLWDDQKQTHFKTQTQRAIERAVQIYLNQSSRAPSSLFDHLYQTLPKPLAFQRKCLADE